MSFVLTRDQRATRDEYADFARESLNRDVAGRYRRGEFDRQLWDICADRGITGLPAGSDVGGGSLSPMDTILALEGFAYGCEDGGLGFALGAHLLSCVVPVWLHGSTDLKKRLLPQLCAGKLIACNAVTEEQSGSAAFTMESRGVAVADGYQLTGRKSFSANAPVSDVCLAYVMTNPEKGYTGGVTGFLLERAKHAYQVVEEVDKPGLRTCLTGRICLDDIQATNDNVVGKVGGGGPIFNESMVWERVGLSAMHVGTMARLTERAVAFARHRKPGGQAISGYQAISHKLADIQARIEASRLLVYQAAADLEGRKASGSSASVAKLFVSESFRSTTIDLMQIYASAGYTENSEISRCLQDALAATIYSGTSEIQRNIIARWMGC